MVGHPKFELEGRLTHLINLKGEPGGKKESPKVENSGTLMNNELKDLEEEAKEVAFKSNSRPKDDDDDYFEFGDEDEESKRDGSNVFSVVRGTLGDDYDQDRYSIE